MNIFKIFKNKMKTIETKTMLSTEDIFDVIKFNEWFCYHYTGYDGYKGALGIFKRLDKLSPNIINDWFIYLNINYNQNDIEKMENLIRINWLNKKHSN